MRVLLALVIMLGGAALAALPPAYDEYQQARQAGDGAALARLAGADGYVAILAARELARRPELAPAQRLAYAERAARFDNAKKDWLLVGRLREQLGNSGVIDAYERALPLAEAEEALARLAAGGDRQAYAALYRGGAYDTLLQVLPAKEASWRARALYRLGRYREALPWYQAWAASSEEGRLGLGRVLLKLEAYDLAAAVFGGLEGPAAVEGLGEALLGQGDQSGAAATFARAGSAGRWRAAGIYEKLGQTDKARELYRQLARGDSLYADDALLRLWVLARRRGDAADAGWAYAGLEGGLAVLVGKQPFEPPRERSVYITPPRADLVRTLADAGHPDWAWGEVRFELSKQDDPQRRRSYADLLESLGMWGEALKLTKTLGRKSLSDWRMDYPRAYPDAVRAAAREFGLEPELLWAVIRVESRFDPRAQSPTGAKGLMQFTKGTWAEVAARFGAADPFDPEASIRYGAYYLSRQLRAFDGLLVFALSAYNGGPGYTRRALKTAGGDVWDFLRFQPRDEPREYVERVLWAYAVYKALYRQP